MFLPYNFNFNGVNSMPISPIYKNLVLINIISSDIKSSKTHNIINENIVKISNIQDGNNTNFIEINVNEYVDFDITSELLNIKKFDIEIKQHNKAGEIIKIFYLKNCEFINLKNSFIDFDLNDSDILKYKIEYKYETFDYYPDVVAYDRIIKLKSILNKNES